MTSRQSVVVRQLAGNSADLKQAYRLLQNEKVTPQRIVEEYWRGVTTNFRNKHLLVIGDTTTLTLGNHAYRTEVPLIRDNTDKRGFDLHACILVDADTGGSYGVGGVQTYTKAKVSANEEEEQAKLARRKQVWTLGLEEKERAKWLWVPQNAIDNCPAAARYTLVGDREADIYDLMARCLQRNWDFLYRSRCDRTLIHDQRTLHAFLNTHPVACCHEVWLPRTKKRSAHKGWLDIKYAKIIIKQPKCKKDASLPIQIECYVIEAMEHNRTVVGDEEPVHWTLLTSHPVLSVEDALRVIQWYIWRWIIEQVFRTMKKEGLNIEASEVESLNGLEALATMACIAALAILQLVQARDGKTQDQMQQVFLDKEQQLIQVLNTKLQGKTLKQQNPYPPQSLAHASWVIARLGGWKGYQSERPPGPITMVNGLTRFFDIMMGVHIGADPSP